MLCYTRRYLATVPLQIFKLHIALVDLDDTNLQKGRHRDRPTSRCHFELASEQL